MMVPLDRIVLEQQADSDPSSEDDDGNENDGLDQTFNVKICRQWMSNFGKFYLNWIKGFITVNLYFFTHILSQ